MYPKMIVIDSESVKNTASRDIYDLLSKITVLQGFSYGIIGQPAEFIRAGKVSSGITLYIDDIYFGRDVNDLSFLSVDQIDNIIIDERSVQNPGISLYIFTKNYNTEIPVTEIKYRDAFFNYRNLSADIFQNVSKDFSFHLSGEIMDWKDKREYTDNFKFPYEKQNFRLKLNLPEMFSLKPHFETNYLIEDKYRLDSDSAKIKTETVRSAVYFDHKLYRTYDNRIAFVHIYNESYSGSNIFNFYDKFSYSDSIKHFDAMLGMTNEKDAGNLTYINSSFYRKFFINAGINGYYAINEDYDPVFSAHLDLDKDLGAGFSVNSSHGYFMDETNRLSHTDGLIENYFSVNKIFKLNNSTYNLSTGYNIFDYKNEHEINYFRIELGAQWINKIKFSAETVKSASGKIYDAIYQNNISQISFSDKYFNEKLFINLALNHRYSEYYIADRMEYANNLSFNLRARIVNFEFFFGSDNFLKDKYEFNNQFYEVNKHYNYQTVDGFDMRTKDEIWGVRWTFYQ